MAVGQKSNNRKYFEIRKIGNDAYVASYLGSSDKPDDIRQGFGEMRKVSKNGVDRYYDTFGFISGKITNLFVRKEEINGQEISMLNVMLDDNGDQYALKLGDLYGSYSRQFFQRIISHEVSTEAEILIEPYKFTKPDKSIGTALTVKLGDRNIQVKDEAKNFLPFLGGMPVGVPIMVQGKPMTDYTDQVKWLMAQIKAKFPPEVFAKPESSSYQESTKVIPTNQTNTAAQGQTNTAQPTINNRQADPVTSATPQSQATAPNTAQAAQAVQAPEMADEDDDLPF